ncbi:hypothetical protein PF010_g14401 [Phytophthora fragariae]|uniref:Uncharacterized protein n=1 Tax=Phytophthora fragariae TaxID=53985 RepID=A0A6A3TNB9_9STRA|nr:hypothetical protein PF003_g37139 [Phytophthora fragariae]KAE9001116.1 hypothetical protein PF011_g13883 [Phytophthora fragariae]KAE9101596.1 hypothetical protein PF010_g14401 [Phytophthora fragariae]KAE9139972.1 hypothetical protein PF006_g13630 [Phytophthora fragariae]
MATFDKVREALALLAAVAHVDQLAWKYLLQNHCYVELGGGGEGNFPLEDIPVRFILIILEKQGQSKAYPVSLEGDLVHLCGVRQRTHTSRDYQVALEKIAALDKNLKSGKPGVDVKIPVRMWFHIDSAKEMSSESLEMIQRAEEINRLHWAKYEQSSNFHEVAAGSIRCTFVLEPLMADFNDHLITREVVEEVELMSCPKPEELVICEYFVDVRLTFSEYQANGEPLPSLNCHWDDIIALSADLSDENNPLAKCVRRQRVRLMNRADSWGAFPRNYDALNFDQHVHSLLQMLEANRNIEYLDVVVADVQEYAEDFKKHNRQPTNRSIKLAMESKAAFLSVLAFGKSQKSKRHKPSQTQSTASTSVDSTLPQLDQLIVSNIFVLAVTPIFRQVHFRRPGDNSAVEQHFQLHI